PFKGLPQVRNYWNSDRYIQFETNFSALVAKVANSETKTAGECVFSKEEIWHQMQEFLDSQ
ncbi:hypothetical protein HDU79_011170, partial [Rhizoclosmatium sp. JEL0117]